MKLQEVVIWCAALALLVGLLTFVIYTHMSGPRPVHTVDLPYYFQVGNSSGFDLATDVLRFGLVAKGATNSRDVFVNHSTASYVTVGVRGDGKGLIHVEQPVVYLENGSGTFAFSVTAGPQTRIGEYTGVLRFFYYEEQTVNS